MEAEMFQPQLIPLTRWADGSIRLGNTRVLLEMVISAFNEGSTPEEIVISYPTLKLAEVYGTITYYLENRTQIDAYIAQRTTEADQLWATIETDENQKSLRKKLLARKAEKSA